MSLRPRTTTLSILVLFVVLAASPVSAEEPSPAFKALLAGNVAAHVAEVSTTLSALRRPGLREGNAVMAWAQDRPLAMSATRASVVDFSSWGKLQVYKRRPKLAWTWVVAETALISWVAIHNHRLSHTRRGP